MLLLHGTTRQRAESLLRTGPDPSFVEPGGRGAAESFSMAGADGPFPFGTPEEYARSKARQFPHEGGPAILAVDMPESIIDLAANEWFPLDQGLVQFDIGAGLLELIAVWPMLPKTIRGRP